MWVESASVERRRLFLEARRAERERRGKGHDTSGNKNVERTYAPDQTRTQCLKALAMRRTARAKACVLLAPL